MRSGKTSGINNLSCEILFAVAKARMGKIHHKLKFAEHLNHDVILDLG